MSFIKLNEEFEITFKVERVLKINDLNYCSLYYKVISYDSYDGSIPTTGIANGYFLNVYEGDTYFTRAKFIDSPTQGFVLKIIGIPTLEIPGTAMELARYAAKNINGVSIATMKKVIEYLGTDFINVVNENPESIKVIPKLTQARRDKIIEWCSNHDSLESLISELLTFGISPKETIRIFKKYGRASLYQIENNPYSLYRYGCLNFKDTDKLVAKQEIFKRDSSERIQCALLAFIDAQEKSGDMCVRQEIITEIFNKFLEFNSGFKEVVEIPKDRILYELIQLVNDGFLVKETAKSVIVYYKKDNFKIENECANFISNIFDKKSYLNAEKNNIKKLIEEDGRLSDKQKEATFNCLTNKFSILTGGPGTGKTFTIQAILRIIECFKNMDGKSPIVTLAAPTGKAAARMYEVTEHEANTLHNALHLMPDDEFNPDSDYQLNSDWIIIDEASMIDEKLFHYLINHISPKTNIILCGDSNQLPSVGPGNVLFQLLVNGMVVHTELDRIFRQSGSSNTIIDYAHAIKTAKVDIINSINLDIKSRDFEFINYDNESQIADEILSQYRFLIQNRVTPDNIMILTPVHKTFVGTEMLNKMIQKEYNPNATDDIHQKFFRGDRVIRLKNDKDLNIHNGDLGNVVNVFKDKDPETEEYVYSLEVQFDDKEDTTFINDLSNMDLAYAMTIHKSQGSESDYVIMPFSKTKLHEKMLTNRLIYTGLTRAKSKFIGIGSQQIFKKGCLQKDQKPRQTLLSYLIKKKLNKELANI